MPKPEDFLPMLPTKGPPLPRVLGQGWPGRTSISEKKLQELIDDVPDVDDPSKINYWIKETDYWGYLEGWSDACLTGTGFPPIEGGMWDEKVKYIRDLTPGILDRKAKEHGLRLIKGGFKEKTEEDFPEYLYGVTYGVYEKAIGGQK